MYVLQICLRQNNKNMCVTCWKKKIASVGHVGWNYFLTHLSWKLKWAFLIALRPSVCISVCLFLCPSVNFYIFDFSSRTTGSISTRLGTNHPLVEGFQVCSNKRDSPSPRGDNSKRVKIHWTFLKIFFYRTSKPKFFSRTSRLNSIKLNTNYVWVKEIQVCSNKVPCPLQRGDNHKNI
jgi:hypothetical protein